MRYVPAVMVVAVALASWGCEGRPGTAGVTGIEQHVRTHTLYTPDEVRWQPGPPSLPAGAEYAVLEGDPGDEGLFTMRLRVPDGFTIRPHWHPAVERVTVLEGTFHLGMGKTFSPDAAEALPAGSYFYMPPEMVHFAVAEGETVLQLTGIGPWGIEYVDLADDPRGAGD